MAAIQRSAAVADVGGALRVSVVHVRTVDPRDRTWEIYQPKYRVYFHDGHGSSFEYEVEGADVEDVISWAEAERRERSYVLYVCTEVEGWV